MRPFTEIQADIERARQINDADALLRFAEELDDHLDPLAEATANRTRGSVNYLHGNYAESLKHFYRAHALFEEKGKREGVGRVMINIGLVHSKQGDYALALEYYENALAISLEIGDRVAEASLANNIGHVHKGTGDIAAALSCYHRGLAVYEELGDLNGVAAAILNIGLAHSCIDDYPTALEYYHRSLALSLQLDNKRFAAITISNIGIIFDAIGNYPSALEHFDRALNIYEGLGDKSGLAMITTCIGWTLQSKGDYVTALSYHHRAVAQHEELGELQDMANDICNVVLVHLLLGSDTEAQVYMTKLDAIQIADPALRIWREQCRADLQARGGDHDAAVDTLQRALVEGIEHGLRAKTADVHKALRDLAQKRNDLAGYVEHNNEYTRITSEINGKGTATKLAVQEKQREIEAVQKEHDKHLAVLHSTLPKHIADRVARGEVVNDHHDNAAVLFLDVVGFTKHSSELDATTVVDLLHKIFATFDSICAKHDVMKIKTIGDSYMAVAFGEVESEERRVEGGEQSSSCVINVAAAALKMINCVFTWPNKHERVQFRIGIHNGPVVAGVLGTDRLQYDVWGDTVNVASRMESTSEPDRIHVTEQFAISLSPLSAKEWGLGESSRLILRGETEIKGKGPLTTYWLESAAT